MNLVEPIRDRKKIRDLKKYLIGEGNMRNYCLMFLGLNVALRISDLIKLRWLDVFDNDFKIRDSLRLIEIKTSKGRLIELNESSRDAIMKHFNSLYQIPTIEDYIFESRQEKDSVKKYITREMAWRIIKTSCEGVGIRDRVGTHTLRKTWGYWSHKEGVSLALIMEALNHSSISVTKRYLGLTQDDLKDVYNKIQF
jgi:integrase